MAQLPPDLSHKHIGEWTSGDVAVWLASIGMDRYVPPFKSAEVDGARLCEITESDLEAAYSVERASHRKKIWRRLNYLRARGEGGLAKAPGGTDQRKNQGLGLLSSGSSASRGTTTVDGGDDMTARRYKSLELGLYLSRRDGDPGCTYCREDGRSAAVHCPCCEEFLCGSCDSKVHRHIKRRGHRRIQLSKFCDSGQAIIGLFRFVKCRNELRERGRAAFRFSFDPRLRRNIYWNLHSKSKGPSKPFCVGADEIEPYLTNDQAADKIASAYGCWRARLLVLCLLQEQYHKVWSMGKGQYVYRYIGRPTPTPIDANRRVKSEHGPRADLYHKPIYLHSHDLPVLLTADLAALRIQLFFLTSIAKIASRSKIRSILKRVLDPVTGRYFYSNPRTGRKIWKKPALLRGAPWDPADVRFWNVDDVFLHFRRMGLAKLGYTRLVRTFGVDGLLLLAFERQDLLSLGLDRISAKRIMLDLGENCFVRNHVPLETDLRRRDIYRRHQKIVSAVVRIQTSFRRKMAFQKAVYQGLRKHRRELQEQRKGVMRGDILWWSDLVKNTSFRDCISGQFLISETLAVRDNMLEKYEVSKEELMEKSGKAGGGLLRSVQAYY